MFKFRTMRLETEPGRARLAEENDSRVTRVGRFLRRTRLDEIPQFLNVLRGNMSVVGPRPEQPEIMESLILAIPYFEERMRDVKPGITGLAQINLDYTGRPRAGSDVAKLEGLTNPFQFSEAEGAVADHMRFKLLYDLAYCATLENLAAYVRTELKVLTGTPLVMLRGLGR